jgi:hypothetical protein
MGLQPPPECNVVTDDLDNVQAEGATGAGRTVFSVMRATGLQDKGLPEWRLYSRIYTEQTSEMESAALVTTTWACLAQARLLSAGHFDPARVPFLQGEFRQVPRLEEPDWYPNPANYGGLVDGEARYQRYWNGTDWTDDVRVREGRAWTHVKLPLNAEPND